MLVVDPIKSFLSPTLQLKEGKRSGRRDLPFQFHNRTKGSYTQVCALMDFFCAGHFIVGVVGRALNYLALRYGLLVLVSGHG